MIICILWGKNPPRNLFSLINDKGLETLDDSAVTDEVDLPGIGKFSSYMNNPS